MTGEHQEFSPRAGASYDVVRQSSDAGSRHVPPAAGLPVTVAIGLAFENSAASLVRVSSADCFTTGLFLRIDQYWASPASTDEEWEEKQDRFFDGAQIEMHFDVGDLGSAVTSDQGGSARRGARVAKWESYFWIHGLQPAREIPCQLLFEFPGFEAVSFDLDGSAIHRAQLDARNFVAIGTTTSN